MLKKTEDVAAADAPPPAPAAVAVRLVSDPAPRLLYVAAGEQRAETVAALAAAFAPEACTILLPASDALPGDGGPPSAANAGLRTAALRRLRVAMQADPAPRILLVTSAEAIAARFAPPGALDEAPPAFAVGTPLDPDAFAARAEALGYVVDDLIDEPGEVAVRGSVVDIFPADRCAPVRIEHEDGRVTGLRAYDPLTQLGTEPLDEVTIGHAREPDPAGTGVPLTDHLPDAAIVMEPAAAARRDRFVALAADGRPRRRGAGSLIHAAAWDAAIAGRVMAPGAIEAGPVPRFAERRDPARAFGRFAKGVTADGRLLVAGSARDLRFLAARTRLAAEPVASLAEAAARPVGSISTLVAPIDRGFVQDGLTIVAAADLLGSRARIDDAAPASAGGGLPASGDLAVGDLVVHEDHGIAAIAGLEAMADGAGDAIVLDHAKGARRLVPVAEADLIWRYGADRDAVALDTLDGASWTKRRATIDAAIAESARALGALAAERDARTTEPIVPPAAAYEAFVGGFDFAPTADQARAFDAVRADLASGRPMDRLVVGDVGYGKTEVALRAAALAVLAGRQVAIVAPTTVLARQHLDTFRARFEGSGIAVAGLSRLTPAAEAKQVKAGLADGSIGLVVGTAAVAGKSVSFKDLALVVVDEEQRFGAAAKAKLRALGAGHVLTLSATPIPRTLQSALVGLQAISVIATPPARRRPIRTIVAPFEEQAVRKALLREHGRGGQSFVVVPQIAQIEPLRAVLARLVPELGIVVAHGKLDADALDEAMVDFARGDGDVLLATNIIEAGLDVPRANTMIVHHADRFGLSQLHQLRGRVGRGGRRGQIMLLTQGEARIAEATMKRLRTLEAHDQLGAGFAISARDLDMRGAGDLVGEEQAGHMKLIGVDLYQHLLGLAIRAARGEPVDRSRPELNLGLGGRLPEDWIPEVDVRLSLYGRLARLETLGDIDAFEGDLEDRFGTAPAEAAALIEERRLAALARAAGVRQVDAGPAAIALTMRGAAAAPPAGLEEANGRWLLRERIADPMARAGRLRDLLDAIGD